jgi:predicted nucleotidyltransferase
MKPARLHRMRTGPTTPNNVELQHRFVTSVLPRIQQEPHIAGVAIAGSMARGIPDEYSDVDLIVVTQDSAFDEVMSNRFTLIQAWTSLVIGFTGEHVGEPRLIITLVGPPLLHVDFKFMSASSFAERDDEPVILWDRDGGLALRSLTAPQPPLDRQWIEDRFWVWVHYGATKLGRGELFEVINFLSYLREAALGPLIAQRIGIPARGVRHLEALAPAEATALRATVCGYDLHEAGQALLATVDLYRRWQDNTTIDRRHDAERYARNYLRLVVGTKDMSPK